MCINIYFGSAVARLLLLLYSMHESVQSYACVLLCSCVWVRMCARTFSLFFLLFLFRLLLFFGSFQEKERRKEDENFLSQMNGDELKIRDSYTKSYNTRTHTRTQHHMHEAAHHHHFNEAPSSFDSLFFSHFGTKVHNKFLMRHIHFMNTTAIQKSTTACRSVCVCLFHSARLPLLSLSLARSVCMCVTYFQFLFCFVRIFSTLNQLIHARSTPECTLIWIFRVRFLCLPFRYYI